MGTWGPPLRIARRTTRRHLGRTLLVAALIGLPVFAATLLGVSGRTANPTGETLAGVTIGQADARLTVTPYGKLQTVDEGPNLYGLPGPPEGHEKPVRDPATFDPRPLLPAGSTAVRAPSEMGSADIKGPSTTNGASVIVGEAQHPLAGGLSRLDEGRFPVAPTEVAITPAFAKHLGVTVGGTMQDAKGRSYQIVGLARPISQPGNWWIFAPPGTPLISLADNPEIPWLVDLPAGTDPLTLYPALSGHGLYLLPRANIVDPPGDFGGGGVGPYAAMALAIGFGILEIVLLAGTAFAVGARRQTRELGLVLSTGGTPRDVRRIVLLQGLFAGAVGVLGGLVLAAITLVVGRQLLEELNGSLLVGWQVPWGGIILIAALGLAAGLAAAALPAISASRQTPMAALSGRFAATIARTTIRKPAVLMIITGVFLVLIGSGLLAAELAAVRNAQTYGGSPRTSATPTGPIALVLMGITAVVSGLVWMLPSLVGKLAGLARHLPLSGRLALRDAARHRHRTGPATAAIMMAVAATAAIAFAGANSTAADAATYMPQGQLGNAMVRFGSDSASVPYTAATEERIAGQLPTERVYRFGMIEASGTPAGGYQSWMSASGGPTGTQSDFVGGLVVVDPAYLDAAGPEGRKVADRLRAGDAVVPHAQFTTTGTVRIDGFSSTEGPKTLATHKATYAGPYPKIELFQDQVLIGPDAAAKIGKVGTFAVEYELKRLPTDDEITAVDRLLGHDGLLVVEKGYQDPTRRLLIGVIVAAAVVTLLGVAISVSLSAAEGRADLATLAAIGAPPRRRRSLAAAQAWVLGQLGCVLGVGVGALYGYTAHAAFGSPTFAVPWLSLATIVIVVPLFAGLIAWALTRSRLPMVARID
ncbi:FtsX-like permease family protein [Kribbella sp. NPDC056345]|uniref:FtsX-like permease family protein n=1 Tax=Kribbella sp. NPDC056345 TaxID=3345789 RepID=UPI0035DBFA03